jgi:hypothetical protein
MNEHKRYVWYYHTVYVIYAGGLVDYTSDYETGYCYLATDDGLTAMTQLVNKLGEGYKVTWLQLLGEIEELT